MLNLTIYDEEELHEFRKSAGPANVIANPRKRKGVILSSKGKRTVKGIKSRYTR